jgi:hypothetical protein
VPSELDCSCLVWGMPVPAQVYIHCVDKDVLLVRVRRMRMRGLIEGWLVWGMLVAAGRRCSRFEGWLIWRGRCVRFLTWHTVAHCYLIIKAPTERLARRRRREPWRIYGNSRRPHWQRWHGWGRGWRRRLVHIERVRARRAHVPQRDVLGVHVARSDGSLVRQAVGAKVCIGEAEPHCAERLPVDALEIVIDMAVQPVDDIAASRCRLVDGEAIAHSVD